MSSSGCCSARCRVPIRVALGELKLPRSLFGKLVGWMARGGALGPKPFARGLPEHAWRFDGLEYHGQLSFLKAGLQLATLISTVSPTYASEIQDEAFGYGLAPLLRHRAGALRGILNGVDTALWNPAADPALAAPYAANRLAAKRDNKRALQLEMGLEPAVDRPLFGIIGRAGRCAVRLYARPLASATACAS